MGTAGIVNAVTMQEKLSRDTTTATMPPHPTAAVTAVIADDDRPLNMPQLPSDQPNAVQQW